MSLGDTRLDFAFHDAVLSLEGDYPPFMHYVTDFLPALRGTRSSRPDVRVRLHWGAQPSKQWRVAGVRRWGRRLLEAGGRVLQTEVLSLPGLQVEAGWQEEQLEFDAYFRPVSRLLRPALRFGGPVLNSLRQGLFGALSYYLVYFPLLHYLEVQRGWTLLHAAGVAFPETSCLLVGLGGSGKSTLSLALLTEPRARLLADNLLLTDGARVYACPEALRLSPASLALLPTDVLNRLEPAGRSVSHGRNDFQLAEADRVAQAQPQTVFFLEQGERTELRATPGDPLDRWAAFDWLAREMVAYRSFAAPLELVAPESGLARARQARVVELLSRTTAYDLSLKLDGDFEQAVRQVRSHLTEISGQSTGGPQLEKPV